MITLTHLRALLERALLRTDNPAILRLPEAERTVNGVARGYLKGGFWSSVSSDLLPSRYPHDARHFRQVIGPTYEDVASLILTDPGTVHALLTALALALGLDPGETCVAVRWRFMWTSWVLEGCEVDERAKGACFFMPKEASHADYEPRGRLIANAWFFDSHVVAAEPDPLKALALAVHHVLGVEP